MNLIEKYPHPFFSLIIILSGIVMVLLVGDRPGVFEVINNTVILNSTVVYNYTTTVPSVLTEKVYYNSKQWLGYPINKQCEGFNPNKAEKYWIKGNSMVPTFWPGNDLLVKKYSSAIGLSPGTILAVSTPQGTVIHRVNSVYSDGFTMQGDNNEFPDPTYYSYDDIERVVCGVLY